MVEAQEMGRDYIVHGTDSPIARLATDIIENRREVFAGYGIKDDNEFCQALANALAMLVARSGCTIDEGYVAFRIFHEVMRDSFLLNRPPEGSG